MLINLINNPIGVEEYNKFLKEYNEIISMVLGDGIDGVIILENYPKLKALRLSALNPPWFGMPRI